MQLKKKHKDKIENLVISALKDSSKEGGLAFDSKYAQRIEDEILNWKNSTFSQANNDNFHEVRVPFSKEKFFWPEKSYGKLDSQCFFSFLELGVWLTYLGLPAKSVFWDVGSHHGVDTLVMHSLVKNASVVSFEPEPQSCIEFRSIRSYNFKNKIKTNTLLIEAGLSDRWEICDFVRVKGNTTANHIKGNREYHGEIETLTVQTIPHSCFKYPNFMKVNIEGHEKILIPSFPKNISEHCDIIIEIHSEQDMLKVYDYAKENKIRIFTQSSGYRNVNSFENLPKNNREGYVLLSKKDSQNYLEIENFKIQ